MKKQLPHVAEKTGNYLAARTEQALMDKLPVDQKALNRALKIMEPKNLKRIAIAAAGGSVLVSVVSSISHDRMYKAAVAREMKKQLEPMRKKLDELEEQNVVLYQQNEKLMAELARLKSVQ